MKVERSRVVAAICVTGLAIASAGVAGCGGSGSSTTSTTGAATAAASKTSGSPRLSKPVTLRMLTVPYFAIEQVASAKGFFKKYNLDVQYVQQTQQGLGGVQAILAGKVDTGQSFGVMTPIEIDSRGGSVRDVVSSETSEHGDYRFYVRSDSGISDCAGLKGKTIGIVNTGSYADIALKAYLQTCGLSIDSVKRIAVPLNTMCSELTRGQIDAAGMYSLFYAGCEQQQGNKIKELFRDSTVLPSGKLYAAFLFTDKYIAAHPDVIRAFVAAIKDATAYLRAHPDDAKAIIAKATGIDESLLIVPSYPPGNCIDPQAAAEWTKKLADLGDIDPGSVQPTAWYTNQFNPDCGGS